MAAHPWRLWWFRNALFIALALASTRAAAQGWVKGPYLTNPATDCPPFVFLSLPIPDPKFGTDVLDQFSLGGPGRQLMFMARARNQPVPLFPRTVHRTQGLINSPSLSAGSVHEPTVYHDPRNDRFWVIFAYANDLATRNIARPCELYAMDITAAVANPTTFDPNTLPVSKLTDSPTTATGIFARAFNPTGASGTWWLNGIEAHPAMNTGPCVVDEEHGPTLYFASNERRAGGFGLYAADLDFTGPSVRLLNRREIHHFGTTSLISFFATPGGCGGSYQSSIESSGQWGLFEFHSDEGTWTTATGYGNGSNIADHNGTTIAIGNDPRNSEIAFTRYYLNNNQAFGAILLVPYAKLGFNTDDGVSRIAQAGLRSLFPAIHQTHDGPSWVGKFALPAAGRHGRDPRAVELFLTYTPTCGGERVGGCMTKPYHATLVAVTDISTGIAPRAGTWSQSSPSTYENPAFDDSVGVHGVLKHPERHAFALRPILTHEQRFGWKRREVAPLFGRPSFVLPHYPALADMPVAKVMAGPIHDTDVLPMARRLSGRYDPTTEPRNATSVHALSLRVSCLTKNVLPSSLTAQDVWGIRLFVTDPKVQRHYYAGTARRIERGSGRGYLHHNGGLNNKSDGDAIEFERTRLLSDVPAEPDGSISFLVPANVPIRFSLLSRDGTVLAAQRSHHSWAPGQVDGRCAGCHQHVEGQWRDPRGTLAFQPGHRPFNTLSDTGKLDWDQAGNPVFTVHANTPTRRVPEFKADIWPLLRSECASCHDSSVDPGGSGIARFDMNMPISTAVPRANAALVDRETAVWSWFHNARYVNRYLGAAKSPLAWHFAGVADDQAVRLDGETNARYVNQPESRYWITTRFVPPPPRAPFNPHPGVRDKRMAYKVIEWIDAGAAIDHDLGATGTANGGGVNHDGYQIALSARLVDPWNQPRALVVGFWDVDSNVTSIAVTAGGQTQRFTHPTGFPNGTLSVTLPAGLGTLDSVVVEAADLYDNRSRVEKSLKRLWLEAEPHRGQVTLAAGNRVADQRGRIAFTVSAAPAFAGSPFAIPLSFDIQPGTPVAPLRLGLYELPNFDALAAATFHIGGVLDAQGNGRFSIYLPAAIPGIHDVFGAALVLLPNGVAKSNLVNVGVR